MFVGMANAGMRGHLDGTTRAAAGFGVDWASQNRRSETMPPVRRFAAILAADVAGYSRLMGTEEEGTHERLKGHISELIEPKIAEHRGRIVKNTGATNERRSNIGLARRGRHCRKIERSSVPICEHRHVPRPTVSTAQNVRRS